VRLANFLGYFSMIPTTFWITGLPGSGKTTLAGTLREFLLEQDVQVIWLDGDVLRDVLGKEGLFSKAERLEVAHTYRKLALMLQSQGFSVIVSTVSLFHEIHIANRLSFGSYFEIFLESNYEKSRTGPRAHLHLLQDSYNPFLSFEAPGSPNMVLRPDALSQEQCGDEVIREVRARFL